MIQLSSVFRALVALFHCLLLSVLTTHQKLRKLDIKERSKSMHLTFPCFLRKTSSLIRRSTTKGTA